MLNNVLEKTVERRSEEGGRGAVETSIRRMDTQGVNYQVLKHTDTCHDMRSFQEREPVSVYPFNLCPTQAV